MLIRYSMRELGRDTGLEGNALACAYSRYVESCRYGQVTLDARELPDDADMFKLPEDFS